MPGRRIAGEGRPDGLLDAVDARPARVPPTGFAMAADRARRPRRRSWRAGTPRRAVAGADALVERRRRLRRRAGAPVGAVAEAEAVEPAAPLLEEGDHGVQRIERAHAKPGVVAPARMRPAAVAVLAARGQRDDIGAPRRPAAAAEADSRAESGPRGNRAAMPRSLRWTIELKGRGRVDRGTRRPRGGTDEPTPRTSSPRTSPDRRERMHALKTANNHFARLIEEYNELNRTISPRRNAGRADHRGRRGGTQAPPRAPQGRDRGDARWRGKDCRRGVAATPRARRRAAHARRVLSQPLPEGEVECAGGAPGEGLRPIR